jgi:hypothetical protein
MQPMEKHNYVIQRIVKTHEVTHHGRLSTWRTVSLPITEQAAVAQLSNFCGEGEGMHRGLCSPSRAEMKLGAEVTEWTL